MFIATIVPRQLRWNGSLFTLTIIKRIHHCFLSQNSNKQVTRVLLSFNFSSRRIFLLLIVTKSMIDTRISWSTRPIINLSSLPFFVFILFNERMRSRRALPLCTLLRDCLTEGSVLCFYRTRASRRIRESPQESRRARDYTMQRVELDCSRRSHSMIYNTSVSAQESVIPKFVCDARAEYAMRIP